MRRVRNSFSDSADKDILAEHDDGDSIEFYGVSYKLTNEQLEGSMRWIHIYGIERTIEYLEKCDKENRKSPYDYC